MAVQRVWRHWLIGYSGAMERQLSKDTKSGVRNFSPPSSRPSQKDFYGWLELCDKLQNRK